MFRTIGLCSLLCIVIWSCEESIAPPLSDFGYNYFPLEQGREWVYQLDSVIYNDFEQRIDTFRYQLKEVVGDTSRDNEGQLYYRINRYMRNDSSETWRFRNVWRAQVIDYQAHRIENNQRFIKLAFPPRLDKYWDGTVYINADTTVSIPGGSINIYKDWDDFTYLGVDEWEQIGNANFDSTLFVRQVDKENNIERRYSIEQYARGVGLIYKEMLILDTQCGGNIADCIDDPWVEKAEKGFILRQTLIDYR